MNALTVCGGAGTRLRNLFVGDISGVVDGFRRGQSDARVPQTPVPEPTARAARGPVRARPVTQTWGRRHRS